MKSTLRLTAVNLISSQVAGAELNRGKSASPDQIGLLLRWLAVLGIGSHGWQLLVAQVELHPQSTGCLWCDLQRMVRRLHFRFLHLSGLPQSSEPVVVRFTDAYFRYRTEFLASV